MAARRFSSVPEAVRTTTSQRGAASRSFGRAVSPSMPGIERSRSTRSGCRRSASTIASAPSEATPTTSSPWARRSVASASRVRGWSSAMRILVATPTLIGRNRSADKREVKKKRNKGRSDIQAWLWGETLLAGLLGASLALFLVYPVLQTNWDLPELRLVLQTTMAGGGLLVAVLGAARYSADGRRIDLLLASGFFVTSLSAMAFGIGPRLGGHEIQPAESWSALIGAIAGTALLAAAPFAQGRSKYRDWAIANAVAAVGIGLFVAWSLLRALGHALPELTPTAADSQPFY